MSHTRLDSRTILIEKHEHLPMLEDRPEPTEEERQAAKRADRIKRSALRKLFVCDDEQFQRVIDAGGFPRPIAHTMPTWLTGSREAIWSRDQINRWIERQRALASVLPEQV